MQVLLLKDVEGLGHAGDIKHVAGGHAQNFLIPRRLAIPADEGALKQAKSIREAADRRRARKNSEAAALAEKLNGQVLTFTARAGEGDRLYGSITNHDVAQALGAAVGTEIDHHYVSLEHPIKSLGDHRVAVKVGPNASAMVTVHVEREGEPA